MILRVVSLALFACLGLSACGGGGGERAAAPPTPFALPKTQVQLATLSTTTSTTIGSLWNGIVATIIYPAASTNAAMSVAVMTGNPSGSSSFVGLIYLCAVPTQTVSFGSLPTFSISAPASDIPSGSSVLVAEYTIGSSSTWTTIGGPLTATSSPGTYSATNTLGPSTPVTFAANQSTCFGFTALSSFGSTTVTI